MKTKILSLVAILAMSFTSIAQIDRSKMPEPGPAPKVKLGESKKFILKNGLTVIMVENHKLPRASVNLTIDNYPSFEGDKAGVSSMMGSLLGRGTTNISKDEFNERVDYLGAYLSFSSGGAYGASLKKYFPEILELMADGVKNSQFTQEEFEKEQKITLDGIKSNEKSVTSAARRVENALTYGKEHPFGEFITKETVKNITLKDVENRYKNYYKPNNAYLIIIGDINPKKIKKMVKKLFSDWKSGSIPEYTMPKVNNVETTEINFINMDNAVQSEIAVVNSLDLTLGDKDYYAALLANQILGGGGTARLFQNLREDKAYTYGSYSRVRQSRYVGTFKATASVRNMVTDSSVVEIQKEINKIRYQKVSEQDLRDAKELYIGNFVMEVQKPATAARYALNRELYNLPEDYYETYLEKINAVTINDLQDAAIKYFKGDKARIIITGKGIDVLKNLEKNSDYKINYFDKFGNPSEKPKMTLPIPEGVTASSVIDSYFNAIGGADKIAAIKTLAMTYNATIQGTPIVLTTKVAAPNKTTNTISVMGQTMQKQAFNGENGYNEMRGQKKEFDEKEINKSKSNTAPFSDMAYKNGLLDRIEPVDGKNAYVIKSGTTEIYYDVATGLKLQSVEVVKTPDGKETKVPTIFSDYKEVGGVLFAHKRDQVTPQFTLNFVLQDVKINEGVEDKDFE
jgi:predicted Zn-dependent peptidase